MTLKAFLRESGIAYTTHHYWDKQLERESVPLPIAPITLHRDALRIPRMAVAPTGCAGHGVMVAFHNGVRTHFGQGSEGVLMELLTKSMDHVMP